MLKLRAALLLGTVMPLIAGCGADDIASPGEGVIVTPPGTPAPPPPPPPPPPGTPAAACPTIEGVTDAGTIGSFRICRLPSSISTDRRLTYVANLAYMIDGRVDVGIDLGGATAGNSTGRSAILTIDPGVIVFGNGGDANNDFLVVNRGSRIQAEGTVAQPIIFTARENIAGTATDTSQSLWGGVILAGRAPISDCDPTVSTSLVGGTAGCSRIVEGTGNALGGGEIANDSSGTFRYVQIRYSGVAISQGNELQGLTTVGAGSGTVIDHVQVHNSGDDGIEVFGGRQNMRYLVMTGTDDDDLDTDNGYQGLVQFVLGIKRTGNGSSDPRNLEVDSSGNVDSGPRQNLRLANFTFIHPLNFAEAMLLRGGADATLVNGIVTSTTAACLDIDDARTAGPAGSFTDPNGTPSPDLGAPVFNSVFFQCAGGPFLNDTNVTGAEIQAIFNAGSNNVATGSNGLTNGYFPGTGAQAVTPFNAATLNPSGVSFMVTTPYIGAVSGAADTWFQGWTCNSGYASFGTASRNCTALPTV